jgi:hypothetical protein
MRERDSQTIGDIYGKMLNTFKHNIHESTKIKKGGNDFSDKDPLAKGDKDGPNVDGYNKAMNDSQYDDDEDNEEEVSERIQRQMNTPHAKKIEKFKKILNDPNSTPTAKRAAQEQLDGCERAESEEIEECTKKNGKTLNKFMSKSTFDKLYSKVLRENFGQEDEGGDIDALGLDDATPDSDMDEDFGGEDEFGDEGEDSVTFTLDRATAQTLIGVLQGAMGDEEDVGEEGEGDDLDFGDEGEDDFGGEGEDDDFNFEEDEEEGTKVEANPQAKVKAFQSRSNKVPSKVKPKGSKTAKTDETGTKTTTPSYTALQGNSNKVSNLKPGQDYFR